MVWSILNMNINTFRFFTLIAHFYIGISFILMALKDFTGSLTIMFIALINFIGGILFSLND